MSGVLTYTAVHLPDSGYYFAFFEDGLGNAYLHIVLVLGTVATYVPPFTNDLLHRTDGFLGSYIWRFSFWPLVRPEADVSCRHELSPSQLIEMALSSTSKHRQRLGQQSLRRLIAYHHSRPSRIGFKTKSTFLNLK
jgi:hypothetical protein